MSPNKVDGKHSKALQEAFNISNRTKRSNIVNVFGNMSNPENKIEETALTPNKKTKVIFQFLYYPEYVTKGIYIIINENNLKAFGRVTHILYDTLNKFDSAVTVSNKSKRKRSVPPQQVASTFMEEHKRFEGELCSPLMNAPKGRRRAQTSHSMCIKETLEEQV